MRVALVFPGVALHGFNSYGSVPEATWIHHGLCMLSACARAAGHEVRLLDLRRLRGYEHLVRELAESRPECVGISAMSVDYGVAVQAARRVKAAMPVPVVVGGAHPTLMTEEVEREPSFDYIIRGEGELAFPELLGELERRESPPRVRTGERPDLDALPFADRGAFGGPEAPIPGVDLPGPLVTVIAGRGCIYNCRFCQPAERAIFGARVRRRSPSSVIAELLHVRYTQGLGSVMLHDDCLTEDPGWVSAFCEAYRDQIRAPFVCQSRADIVVNSRELFAEMVEAGLALVIIGFESGNQRILDFLRKRTTVEQNHQAAQVCRELGVKVWANYMLGIPTETPAEMLDTVTMIRSIRPEVNSPSFYTAHPGTDLFAYCEEHGLLPTRMTWDRSPRGQKIRGVDYRFVRWARDEALGVHDLPIRARARLAIGRCLDRAPHLKRALRRLTGG